MRVELTEHPKGNQRFEILLGEMVYVISLEEGKQLADWIYELHPTADTRGEHAEVFEGSGMMPYTLEGMKNYYAENKQDYLAPILHDAIEKIAQLESENEALRERNLQGTYCAYCGEEFPLDIDHTYLRVGIHIWECEKHPLNTLCEALEEKLKDLDFDAQERLTTGKENDLSHASGIHKSIDSVREVLDDGRRHCKDMKNELDALLADTQFTGGTTPTYFSGQDKGVDNESE